MSCSDVVCGTGGWTGPLPGDPDNNLLLSATPAFGGIDVNWTYPGINPHAVSFVKLYRATSNSFALALQIANVSGSFYYDKLNTGTTYYYWIKVVSINGTEGDLIGPASATAKPLIQDLITQLTGQIDEGVLAQSLKTDIEKISLIGQDLLDEVQNRLDGNLALQATLAAVQSDTGEALTYILNEVTQRTDADSAMVRSINAISAGLDNNAAALVEERLVRVDATSALSQSQLALDAQLNHASTGLPATRSSLINNYYTKVGTDSAIAAANLTLNSVVFNPTTGLAATRSSLINDYYTKAGTNSAISTATFGLVSQTALNTKLTEYTNTAALQNNYFTKTDTTTAIANATSNLSSKTDLANYTTTADLRAAYYTKTGTDSAVASAITTLQVVSPTGGTVGIQQAMTAQYDLNANLKSLYTVKMNVTSPDGKKLIGGYGLYGDSTGIEAGFDVDRFWIGRTNAAARKPFIVEGGTVYIDDAAINKLTFNKLRDESGGFVVEGGKLKANYIHVGEVMGGAFTGYAWPPAGQTGFYLGPQGFAVGNQNNGNYFWVEANGNIHTPGFSVTNGVMTVNQINVINTANISGRSVTSMDSANGVDTASVSVYLNGVSGDTYDVLLLGTAQQPKAGNFRLRDNGSDVIVGIGTGLSSISRRVTGAANSSHTYSMVADFGIQCVLTVFVSKR